MTTLELELLYLEQNPGVVHTIQGNPWIGYCGMTIPPEMAELKEGVGWSFLRADGHAQSRIYQPKECMEVWSRPRATPGRVVGYWYPGARRRDNRQVKPVEQTDTFELEGHRWTRCDPANGVPERLKGKASKTWWRYDSACGVTKDTGGGEWLGYWGPTRNSSFNTTAFCIPAEDKIDSSLHFEQGGFRWTKFVDKNMPADLKDVGAKEWMTIDDAGHIQQRLFDAKTPQYWGHERTSLFHAYCITERDRLGPPAVKRVKRKSAFVEALAPQADLSAVVARKVLEKEIAEQEGMLKRDGPSLTSEERQAQLIEKMVGNGNIFAPPKRTTHPLFRVTPITVTGHVMWGAEHD